jgi:hypothetical protein
VSEVTKTKPVEGEAHYYFTVSGENFIRVHLATFLKVGEAEPLIGWVHQVQMGEKGDSWAWEESTYTQEPWEKHIGHKIRARRVSDTSYPFETWKKARVEAIRRANQAVEEAEEALVQARRGLADAVGLSETWSPPS